MAHPAWCPLRILIRNHTQATKRRLSIAEGRRFCWHTPLRALALQRIMTLQGGGMVESSGFSAIRRRPRPGTLVLIVLLHVLAIYGLGRAFAPDFTRSIERDVLSTFTVTITTSEDIPPETQQVPDEGAQGEQGRKAVPRPESAPEAKIPLRKDRPVPRTPAEGTANNSGAKEAGDGTGAAGQGDGTGSGRDGSGAGGAIATKPSVRSGNLDQARDFPVPEGGRATRFGKSVTVVFTVGTDGTAKNCSVARSSVDPQTTGMVCDLVTRKIRFNPATTRDGTPVEARYGYRVDFSAAS
ncbi:MAG: hypothetical protein B7X57_10250 [Erythrobacter sp. 34-65-8]|nr:MAG: hypothetical protein B7X57_10250 [Erythrobacter sp. 34-65-8]